MKYSGSLNKRVLALCLGLCLLGACAPRGGTPTPAPSEAPTPTAAATTTPSESAAPSPSLAEDEKVRVALLKGPTGLGGVKLMEDKANSPTMEFTVFAEPTQAVAALTKGETDIAALPTNLASVLYHKLDGGIQLLCLNTYGVLQILDATGEVESLADLEGKTLHAFGQGANPEYVLNYLLKENGLTLEEDVAVQWYATADELATLLAAGEAELGMLPVPAATAATVKNKDLRLAVDLNDAWEEAGAGGIFTMGCLVARTEFVESCPEAVEQFLIDYQASVDYMTDQSNLDMAAQLSEKHGIVPSKTVAKAAIPGANLCFVTGDEMMDGIQGYYQVLYRADPAAIGGSIPDGAFYYMPPKNSAPPAETPQAKAVPTNIK